MNPITHCLGSWALADTVVQEPRDRHLVTWAGVLPDVDGLGTIVDAGRAVLGKPPSWYYGDYHHLLLHGLPAAVLLPALLAIGGRQRLQVFALGFVAVHLHLLCDVVGSRGPDATDIWPIWYFAPFSDAGAIVWLGQWPVNAWPNIVLTAALLAHVMQVGVRRGYTVVGMFSRAADARVVDALRYRWQRVRRAWRREV